MTYDNLFYNRMAKDLALLAFRAYGWQLGKYRHLTGAVTDTVRGAKQVARGELPTLTHRQLYFVALPLVVGAVGGMLHYLLTGNAPQSPMDYLHPSTGQKDNNGNEKRLSLPSYLKDLESDGMAIKRGWVSGGPLGVGQGLWNATYHRANPWVGEVVDMLNNRDFYGTQIWNPDDPILGKLGDQAKFIAKGFTPFSITGTQRLMEGKHSAREIALPFIGITPAKQELTMTPAQIKAAEIMRGRMGQGGRTSEQAEHSKALAEAVKSIRTGELPAAGSIQDKQDARLVAERLKFTPFQYQVFKMPVDEAMRVFDLANADEKRLLAPILLKKFQSQAQRGEQVNTNYPPVVIKALTEGK